MRFALLALTLLWTQLTNSRGASATRQNAAGMVSTQKHASFGESQNSQNYPALPQMGIEPVGTEYGSPSASLPRKFQCYSCMSLSYQNNWERLQHLYVQPKLFSDRCEHPDQHEQIPTVECGSVCVSLIEADVEGGVFLGFKYIRGCINRIFLHDINLQTLRTHRFNQADLCRFLPRANLFNNPRNAPQVFGEVNICTCFGPKCNHSSQSRSLVNKPNLLILLFALFFAILTDFK